MSKPGENETLPSFLRDHDVRIERLERLPRGNGLPEGGGPGQALVFDPEGNVQWGDVLPPGGNPNDVLAKTASTTNEGDTVAMWQGPIWWAWVGTEEAYNALGEWDDRVLYVIIQEIPGAVTTVTPEDLANVP